MDFLTIEDLYLYLEDDVNSFKREWELTSTIRRLVDQTSDEEIKKKLKWECFVFDFHIQDGEVQPMTSSTTEDGTTIRSYPSYEDFGNEGINYLKQRCATVQSDFLSSRYNHILWNSPAPHKHQQYAKDAVDGYLCILKQLDCCNEQKKDGWDCFQIFKNGCKIAIQSKYKIDEFKLLAHSWLFTTGKFPTETKIILLSYMLDMPCFKKEDFEHSLELVRKIGSARGEKITDYFFSKEIYQTGLKIAQRLGSDTKIWNKRIGDSIVKMADYRMDDETRMIPLSFLKEAIPYYKLAGNEKKVKEVEQRYFELKKELKLSEVKFPMDEAAAKGLAKYLDAKTESLMKAKPQEILGYLLSGTDIFPQMKWLKAMAKNNRMTFMDFATTVRFDINNNVSKDPDDKKFKEDVKIYQSYQFYMQLSVHPFLHRIFIEGIKKNKITFPGIIKFFVDHTWLGQELVDYDSSGEPNKYKWISLIAPSIHEYFIQTESALRSNNPHTNYVMPIDSLTLKFEGVLRDFSRLLHISTTVVGKNNVLREKYIEELLADKELQKYFDENDRLFFNYLFVAKNGMNLRNNIAHSFYRYKNYNFQIMHLLICAFLRIGKYRINEKKIAS